MIALDSSPTPLLALAVGATLVGLACSSPSLPSWLRDPTGATRCGASCPATMGCVGGVCEPLGLEIPVDAGAP